jgi:glycyl-tRNA synthetase
MHECASHYARVCVCVCVWFIDSRDFVDKKPENIRMDSATILNEGVWRASGHADKFRDVVSACKSCNVRSRVDHIPGWTDANARADVACPACGKKGVLGEPSEMNLLFPTRYGTAHDTFLRPETAQGIFINYPHLTKLVRSRFPFGVGQMGKAFRNELNVEHFLFRTREFEMMELEYFCAPHEADFATKYWTEFTFDWLKGIGLNEHKMRLVKHAQGEGAHYALETFDIEYEYPHGRCGGRMKCVV